MENKNLKFIPFVILFFGIIVRLIYGACFTPDAYADYTVFQYTHDSLYHIEYIKFVANHLSLPAVEKGLEFPQQPLYYIFSGGLYHLFDIFLFPQKTILAFLVWVSTLFSIGTLIFTYFVAKKITNLSWVQSFIIGIMAFTPAFVYQAGMIGNDPFCAFLSAGSFFFLISFIQKEKFKYFILATSFAVLSFFTKASAGILLIMILLALIYKYSRKNNVVILKMIYSVLIIGFLCICVSFYRAYIPVTKEFRFVESYTYENQKTNPRLSYFLTFNYSELIKEGQSFVFGNKKIARTFPTFLYGSFIFGEYTFNNITDIYPLTKTLMQFILLLGLLFPIGIIANIFYIKKWNLIDYISAFGVAGSLILIISFLLKYPSVCNSDFRYFSPVFLCLLAISGIGLSRLNENLKIKSILPSLSFVLISSEFCWIVARIFIRVFLNI
jgi:hypothetical protein